MQLRLAAYGSEHLKLQMRVIRELAKGHPVTQDHVDSIVAELGAASDSAHQFLREVTERDRADAIVGTLGLSLADHPHRLTVNDVPLAAWCALDTLFLPSLLRHTATIESTSPASGRPIHVRVTPERVEAVDPASAVVSIILLDLKPEHTESVEAIWSAFCQFTHYFATKEEATQWAADRTDIAIVPVEEGFAIGQQMVSDLLARLA